jgi:hypothetical protein
MWPKAVPGDDIAGSNPLAFWVPEDNGRYVDLSPELGLAVATPTRGVAVADTNGDGAQDFAVARQWGPPAYYRNGVPGDGNFLGLRLHRPTIGQGAATQSPAYGAQVRVTGADGRVQLAQLDGGGGHSGKRSFDIFFGLGDAGASPVEAELTWRDIDGGTHRQTLNLTAGWHDIMLTSGAQELTTP